MFNVILAPIIGLAFLGIIGVILYFCFEGVRDFIKQEFGNE